MLETARLAPSSHNEQPWHFIVIRDEGLKNQLKEMVEAIIEIQSNAARSEEERRKIEGRSFHATHFATAPVVIAVLTIPFPNPPDEEQPPFNQGLQSVAAAIAQLLLAATALGYGGCWCTLPLEFAQKELEALLEVKPPWFLVAMLSIGVPTKVPRQPRRKNLDEIVSFR
jgi:nitroreductase